jgi:hypothetical protein
VVGEEQEVDQTESDLKGLQQAHGRQPEPNHDVEHGHTEGHDTPQETQRPGCHGLVHALQHGSVQEMQEEYNH